MRQTIGIWWEGWAQHWTGALVESLLGQTSKSGDIQNATSLLKIFVWALRTQKQAWISKPSSILEFYILIHLLKEGWGGGDPYSQKAARALTLLVFNIWGRGEVTVQGQSCWGLYLVPTCPEHQQSLSQSMLAIHCLRFWACWRGHKEENFQLGFATTPLLPCTFPTWQHGRGQGYNPSCLWHSEKQAAQCHVLMPLRRDPRHGSSCCCTRGLRAQHHPPSFHFLSSPSPWQSLRHRSVLWGMCFGMKMNTLQSDSVNTKSKFGFFLCQLRRWIQKSPSPPVEALGFPLMSWSCSDPKQMESVICTTLCLDALLTHCSLVSLDISSAAGWLFWNDTENISGEEPDRGPWRKSNQWGCSDGRSLAGPVPSGCALSSGGRKKNLCWLSCLVEVRWSEVPPLLGWH